MGRVAAGELPVLAQHHAGALRHHQHRGHAERMRHFEIAGEVLEDRGLVRIDVVAGEEALVDHRLRLRLELGRPDVEHVVEMMFDFEPAQYRVGMLAGAVGENELAAGELRDGRAERGVRRQRRVVDLVHHLQKFVRLQAVLLHQPAHGGAVAPVIILLQPERLIVA